MTFAERIDAALDNAIRDERIVGAVFLVARHGELAYHRAVGLADREAGVAMREDTLFRLASLTKAVTSVAAMTLLANGSLHLDDPVTKYLPDFRPTFGGSVPVITVRHLLTHTSGLRYAFFEKKDGPYHRARVSDGLDQPGLSIDENLRRLASLPLASEPGAEWAYSLSTDVLGAVLARATKTTLPALVARTVTGPLGMTDTAFTVRDDAQLAVPYADGKPPWKIHDGDYVPYADVGVYFAPSRPFHPASYPSGGSGLVGTAADYLRFLEAVRTRAALFPKREIDEMVRDQVPELTSPVLGDGWGFGLGVSVLRDPAVAKSPMHRGTIKWIGSYGHAWWIDPEAGISAVLLTNTAFEGMSGQVRTDLENAVHTA